MANPFDVFDAGPAASPPRAPAAPPSGNPFDVFDGPPVATPEGALRVRVGGRATPEDVAGMGQGEAAMRGAAQGLTLNFGDELTALGDASGLPGAVRGFLPPGAAAGIGGARMLAETVAPSVFGSSASGTFTHRVEAERRANEAAQAAYPGTYLAGELGGGIAGAVATPALAPFRAAQGAGLVGRGAAAAGNLAATGGAYGAAAGLGEGEGGPVDRLPSAARGAGVGAVAGPVVGGVIHGGAATGRFVADHAGAITSPATLADRFVGRAVQRDAADLPAIADRMEAANVQRTPARLELPNGQVVPVPDGVVIPPSSPLHPFFKPAESTVGGQNLTLADVGGANLQGQAGNVARMPGEGRTPAREFLEGRQVGSDTMSSQGERISDKLGSILGDRGSIAVADEIIARRSKQADTAYRAAYGRQINYDSAEGAKLLDTLDRVPRDARAKANEILRISDREGHQLVWHPDPERGYVLSTVPNTRQLQYVKEGLDAIISQHKNPITGQLDTLGQAVFALKREMLASLDKLNPAYKVARRQFAGESEALDALRAGQKAASPSATPEAIRKELAGMSEAERDLYRLGLGNALRDRVANAGDGNNKVRVVYGTPALREKVNALGLNQKDRTAFHEYLTNESDMFRTRGQMGGSPTAERIGDAADADHAVAAGRIGLSLATGHIGLALKEAARHLAKVNPELRGRVMNEGRKVLLNPDPEAVRSFARRLDALAMNEGTRRRVLSAVTNALPRGITAQATGQ